MNINNEGTLSVKAIQLPFDTEKPFIPVLLTVFITFFIVSLVQRKKKMLKKLT